MPCCSGMPAFILVFGQYSTSRTPVSMYDRQDTPAAPIEPSGTNRCRKWAYRTAYDRVFDSGSSHGLRALLRSDDTSVAYVALTTALQKVYSCFSYACFQCPLPLLSSWTQCFPFPVPLTIRNPHDQARLPRL